MRCLGDIHYSRATWTERDLDKLRDLCRSVDVIVIVGDITSDGRLDLAHDGGGYVYLVNGEEVYSRIYLIKLLNHGNIIRPFYR